MNQNKHNMQFCVVASQGIIGEFTVWGTFDSEHEAKDWAVHNPTMTGLAWTVKELNIPEVKQEPEDQEYEASLAFASGLHQIDEHGGSRTFSLNGVSYQRMVKILGEPNLQDDDSKVDAAWGVKSPDGRKLFAWNYKNGEAYLGDEGRNWKDEVDNWSMDGDSTLASELFGEEHVSGQIWDDPFRTLPNIRG